MPTTCEDYLADILDAHNMSNWQLDTFLEPLKEWFQDARWTHNYFNADWREHVSSMVTTVMYMLSYLTHGNQFGYHPYRVPYYFENCVGGDLDMDTLINTMLTATPAQITYFVGLVDAYRQSIFNKPFNEDFFAALARGFE